MKIINLKVDASRDELIEMLKNNEAVNKNVKFNTEKGTPHIHLKENGEKVKLTCEYMGGAVSKAPMPMIVNIPPFFSRGRHTARD